MGVTVLHFACRKSCELQSTISQFASEKVKVSANFLAPEAQRGCFGSLSGRLEWTLNSISDRDLKPEQMTETNDRDR